MSKDYLLIAWITKCGRRVEHMPNKPGMTARELFDSIEKIEPQFGGGAIQLLKGFDPDHDDDDAPREVIDAKRINRKIVEDLWGTEICLYKDKHCTMGQDDCMLEGDPT